ncbi:MAG: PD-(D/E)XK nuclease family protein [Muribaculum sp.]|nr:PD-(D/E)XK nuclease family protein [Muribaculum sp.]
MSDKELFHSNFLYGLWKNDRENFKLLLEKFGFKSNNYAYLDGKREHNNYDFCLIDTSNPKDKKVVLIIENKVKSIPHKEQLDRYAANFNEEKPYLILLSLMDKFPAYEDIKEDNTWKLISYRDFIAWLKEITWRSDLQQYVKDYCNAMEALLNEVNEYFVDEDSLYFRLKNAREYEDYKELRIHDLFQKSWFSQIGQYVANRIKSEKLKYDLTIQCNTNKIFQEPSSKLIYLNSDYTHSGGGLFEFKILFRTGLILGVQIQDDAYRRFTEYKEEKNFNQNEYYWFFDLDSQSKYNNDEKVENFRYFEESERWKSYRDQGDGIFLKFGPNYKYQKLKIRKDIMIKDLIDLILRDLNLILSKF